MKKKTVHLDNQDKTIIQIVRDAKAIHPKDLEEHELITPNNVKSIYYRLKIKLVPEYIRKIGEGHWHTLYYTPENEAYAIEQAKKEGLKKNRKIIASVDIKDSIEIRMIHTEDIIKIVIKPWIKQLSSKSCCKNLPYGNYFSYLNPERDMYTLEEELPVEKELLFLDFKNHIKSELNNPADELEKFRNNAIRFREKEKSLIGEIDSLLRSHLLRSKEDFIPHWVPCIILDILFKKYEKDFERELIIDSSDFRSQVRFEEGENVVYSINPPMQEIFRINKHCASSERRGEIYKKLEMSFPLIKASEKSEKTIEEETKSHMDKKIMELPRIIDDNNGIRNDIKFLIKIKEELIKTIDNIDISLNQYSYLKNFITALDF